MDRDSEEPFFPNSKEEIVDPEEGEMRLAAGKEEGRPVKEEAVEAPVVKERVDDGENWGSGGCTKRGNPDSGENPEPKKRKWPPGAEAIGYVTQKNLNTEVKLDSHTFNAHVFLSNEYQVKKEIDSFSAVPPPSTDNNLPKARLESFNAHDLLSNEYEKAVKKEDEEEEGQNVAAERINCPVDGCLVNVFSYADLVDHMYIHPNPVICGGCQKPCRCASALRRHYTTHTGEKRFACGFCDKRFADPPGLKRHVRTDHGEGLYECEICGFKTSVFTIMKRHRLSHLGKYTCPVCGFKVAHPATLEDHKAMFNH